MDDKFEKLSPDFYSLGQDISYYININSIDENKDISLTEKILKNLNDISYNNNLYHENINSEVLKTSLLSVSSLSVTGQFNRVANGGVELTEFNFVYKYKAYDNELSLNYSVDPLSIIPTNIHAIIGRNGSRENVLDKRHA